jgi:hypothetical protein
MLAGFPRLMWQLSQSAFADQQAHGIAEQSAAVSDNVRLKDSAKFWDGAGVRLECTDANKPLQRSL